MFMDFNRAFSSKKKSMYLGAYIWFWINRGFYKETIKFDELSFHCVQQLNWGEKLHLLDLLMKNMRSKENTDLKIVKISPSKCKLCHFEPTYISPDLHLYYSFQSISNVFIRSIQYTHAILNQAVPQWAFKLFVINPSQKGARSRASFITIKAFTFVISFMSLCSIFLLFTQL